MLGFASCLRPNYRRARELRAEIEDLQDEIQGHRDRGQHHAAAEALDLLNEAKADLFRCGVPSEYEL